MNLIQHSSIAALFIGMIFLIAACASKRQVAQDDARLQSLMDEHQQDAEECFSSALSTNPDLKGGTLRLRMVQDRSTGKFYDVRQRSGFVGSEPVFKCMKGKIAHWRASRFSTSGPIDMYWNFTNKEALRLNPNKIQQTINEHTTDFDECYSSARAKDKNLPAGQAEYQILIGQDGSVENFREVLGVSGSNELASCLSSKVKNWKFPSKPEASIYSWQWSYAEK